MFSIVNLCFKYTIVQGEEFFLSAYYNVLKMMIQGVSNELVNFVSLFLQNQLWWIDKERLL